jgi:hypothetical protein
MLVKVLATDFMKPSQNSLFKADTYGRSVAESGILGLVHGLPLQESGSSF